MLIEGDGEYGYIYYSLYLYKTWVIHYGKGLVDKMEGWTKG